MGSENLHESPDVLSNETKDLHRAIVSLMEELEAVDWYQQRAEACSDNDLRAVLSHNRDEEIEHAMMNLEWIRRRVPKFAENISTYLNSTGPITAVEAKLKAGEDAPNESETSAAGRAGGESSGAKTSSTSRGSDGSLGIGSLKKPAVTT